MQKVREMLRKLIKGKLAYFAIIFVAVLAFAFNHGRSVVNSADCGSAPTDHPEFNRYPITFTGESCKDYPMIDAVNLSGSGRDARHAQNAQEHQAGINVNAGDQVRVTVYFHNGSVQNLDATTAHNVTVGTNFDPSASTTHTISATVSAANASTIKSADKGGDITLHSAAPVSLAIVPGTAGLCMKYDHAVEVGADLTRTCAGTADGKPIIFVPVSDSVANGSINIGDLKACWPYATQLIYTLAASGGSTNPSTAPNLAITKQVRNATTNSNGAFSAPGGSVSAATNDLVDFQIKVTNNGTAAANNVFVSDALPAGLSFTGGTVSDNNFFNTGTGVSIGSLAVGQTATISFTARVTGGAGTYTNTACIVGASPANCSQAAVNVTTATPTAPVLNITKTVQNITRGGGGPATSVNAQTNDTVAYQITVTNTGTAAANNVSITDNLPSGITATSTLQTNLNTINAGGSQTVTFQARVDGGNGNYTNTACIAGASTCAQATVSVSNGSTPSSPNLTIGKLVRNVTRGGGFAPSVSAQTGDTVEYQITVNNIGTGAANNVNITDVLPSGLTQTTSLQSSLGTINASSSQSVTFQARVDGGNGNYTNTACISGTSTCNQATVNVVNPSNNGGVVGNTYPQIGITKQVMDISPNAPAQSRTLQKSVQAAIGDTVQFQMVVSSTGSQALINPFITDNLPAGLIFQSGSVRVDGIAAGDQLIGNKLYFMPSLMFGGQQHTVTFNAVVANNAPASMQNTAIASADNVTPVQDFAYVTTTQVAGGNIALGFSKSAFNDTKNINATSVPANREDFITYTLTVTNSGNTPATGFVISDDLSGVLTYASMVDPKDGTLNGNIISFPAITIPASGSVSKSFRVRVNYNLPSAGTLQLVNTYGNQVVINIARPQILGVTFIAPKTGATASYAFIFASMLTLAYWLLDRKGYIDALINAIPKIRIE